MSWWESALKAIQLKPRFLFGLFLCCAIVAAMPQGWAEDLDIASVTKPLRGWLVLAAIVFFCFWIVQLVPVLQRARSNRKQRNTILRSLDTLGDHERMLLAYCLYRNRRTVFLELVTFWANVAAGLQHKGLMVMAGGSQNILAWPYTIPEFVWWEMQMRRVELLPPGTEDSPNAQRVFSQLDDAASGRRGAMDIF